MVVHKTSFFVSIMLIVGLVFAPSTLILQADTASDLTQKISDHNVQIDQLEAEIAQFQVQLDTIGKNASTLQSSIKELDLSKKKLTAEIKVTETKIESTNLHIKQLTLDIGDKAKTIDKNNASLAQSIALINQSDTRPFILSLLSNVEITDGLGDIEKIKTVQKKLRDNTREVTAVKTDLEYTKTDVEKARADLVDFQSELADQKKILDQNISQKNKLLADTKDTESNYKKLLAQKIALKNAFEQELRDYEAQLKFTLDPNSIPQAGSSPLGWPLTDVYITQLFGRTVAAQRLYASGTHSGDDFRASIGTPVLAMATGTVIGSGDTDTACKGASFGKWVYIRYDNGLGSVYGHLSLVKAVNGERVHAGDVVAYSGFTGHATGPHLHVGLYVAAAVDVSEKESLVCKGKMLLQPRAALNAYLDPLAYMPKYTSAMIKPDLY